MIESIEFVGGALDGQRRRVSTTMQKYLVPMPPLPIAAREDLDIPEQIEEPGFGEYVRRDIFVRSRRISVMHWEGWR